MKEALSALGRLLRSLIFTEIPKLVRFTIKGFPLTLPLAVIELGFAVMIVVGLYWIVMAIPKAIFDNKEARRKKAEEEAWKKRVAEAEERIRNRTPEESFAVAKQYHDSGSNESAYEIFSSLIGVIPGAEEYAEKSLHAWYSQVVRQISDEEASARRNFRTPSYHGLVQLKRIIDEVDSHNYKGTEKWRKNLLEYYSSTYDAYRRVKIKQAQEDARDRMDEAIARQMQMEEESGYSGSASSGTFDSIDLGSLPDMMYFVNDPDTVYQHYAYMTGGMGQPVRVYMSLDGSRKVPISFAHNGVQVGRDYYTDQGTITKY